MRTTSPPGTLGLIVLALLAAGAFFCGVDAMLSDAVTTPAKVGDGKRVEGSDTVVVGVGWMLVGLAFTAKIILARWHALLGTAVAVALAALGGLCWLIVL